MSHRYIYQLKKKLLKNIGNKADKLCFLMRWKYNVPMTYVCIWQAHMDYLENVAEPLNILKMELSEIIDTEKSYAVRSSANVEDEAEYSYAGQFRTILDVRGIDDILQAIQDVWNSAISVKIETYLNDENIRDKDLKIGVIIQEMVFPVFSGVSFSRNPTTGLDEIIVEAVQGSGESLVQEGATPDRWISKWGDWITIPEQSNIPLEVIGEVVAKTNAIAKDYGKPVDLEWVYNGKVVYWVQLREITSLEGINIYSNKISKEVLPGLIKPLVWSVNVPLVNSAWVRLFTELIGQNYIDPNDLAKAFYYQTYFNMGIIGQIFVALGMPRESLEVLMGIESTGLEKPSFKPTQKTYVHLPRMLLMALDKIQFARKAEKFIPVMLRKYRQFHSNEISQLNEDDLLANIDQLYEMTQETAYYNIVIPLLMQIYNRILKSQLAKLGVDFENFDVTQDMPDLQEMDPNFHLSNLHSKYRSLNPDLQTRIESGGYRNIDEVEYFRESVDKFIERFGHLSDSGNDFSSVPWREEPDLVVRMITNYTAPSDGAERVTYDDLEIPLLKRPLVKSIYRRARQFRLYRERIGSLYTFGYGLFRNYFLALGERLASRCIIEKQDYIFYLYLDEVRDAANPKYPESERLMDLVNMRKQEMKEYSDLVLPSIIYGDQPPPIERGSAAKLKGTPTSRGYYQGPVKVIRGMGHNAVIYFTHGEPETYDPIGWINQFREFDEQGIRFIPFPARPFFAYMLRNKYLQVGKSDHRSMHKKMLRSLEKMYRDVGDQDTKFYISFLDDNPRPDAAAISALNDGASGIIVSEVFLTISNHTAEGEELIKALNIEENFGIDVKYTGPLWDSETLRSMFVRRANANIGDTDKSRVGILLVGHGQPDEWDEEWPTETEQEIAFREEVLKLLEADGYRQENMSLAWMEFKEPKPAPKVEEFVKNGVEKLLFFSAAISADAIHSQYDIPDLVHKANVPDGFPIVNLGAWNDDPIVIKAIKEKIDRQM